MSILYFNGRVNIDNETSKLLALIGSRIRTLRKEKKWTQESLAERAGINDKEVSHIELGNRNITIETLVKIAMSLGVSASILLEEES
jgi:transcriptional regulator with XRE-family HTH domain